METEPYALVVGEQWLELPESIRRSLTAPLKANGKLKIVRATKGFASIFAKMICLPPSGDDISVALELQAFKNGIRWIRKFHGMRTVSTQFFEDDLVVERAGPLQIKYRCKVEENQLFYDQTASKLLGIPLPLGWGPQIHTILSEADEKCSWYLSVKIWHRWFGPICSYEGTMEIQ